ncbi:MAG: hypothetical protein NT003_04665 [Candidatus Magasanikbacteria bacterium]|nr:hypothetical protein [Candidatus Magasanikbacteria bacterium]
MEDIMTAQRTKKQIVSGAFWTAAFVEFLLDEASKRGVGFDELYPLGDTSTEGQELREEIVRMVISRRTQKPAKVEVKKPKPWYGFSERISLTVDRVRALEDQAELIIGGGHARFTEFGLTSKNFPQDPTRPAHVTLVIAEYRRDFENHEALKNAVKDLESERVIRNADPYELIAWFRYMVQSRICYPVAALDMRYRRAEDSGESVRTPVIDNVQEKYSPRGVNFDFFRQDSIGSSRWRFLLVCGSK